MQMNIKVSVIVPVYNAGEQLKSCISSILSQTLREIELILVDDGSTDGSAEICDSYKTDERVRVIHKANSGASEARNAGIAEARGEFIGFADADDRLDPGMLATLYDAAVKTGSDMAFCDYIFCTKNGNKEIKSDLNGDRTYSKNEIRELILPYFFGYSDSEVQNYKNLFPFADYSSYLWLCIYKTSVIRENNLRLLDQKLYYNEDNLFNLNFLLHAERITHISKCLYFYCDNDSSLTKRYFPEFLNAKLRKYDYLRDLIKNNGFDLNFYHRLDNKICIESINIINYYVSSTEISFKDKYKKIVSTLNCNTISEALAKLDLSYIKLSKLFIFLYLEKHKLYRLLLILSSFRNLFRI